MERGATMGVRSKLAAGLASAGLASGGVALLVPASAAADDSTPDVCINICGGGGGSANDGLMTALAAVGDGSQAYETLDEVWMRVTGNHNETVLQLA
jgi:hypothetical protein